MAAAPVGSITVGLEANEALPRCRGRLRRPVVRNDLPRFRCRSGSTADNQCPARPGARGSPAMVAHRLDGQRASAAPAAAGTHCGRPYFGWVCSSPRRWLRSGGRRLGLLRGVEGGGAISCGCIWGEPFSRCVDHLRGNDGELLAVTQTRFVKRPPIVEVVAAVDSQDYQGPSVQGVELR